MRRTMIVVMPLVALCLLAAAAIATAGQSLQPAPQPRIAFAETTFDLGSAYQNDEVTHIFKFRNTGNATLRIGEVKSTCGCTAATLEGREFAPGAEGSIKITFRTGGYRDRVTKHLTVDSNDPVDPQVTLTIQCLVKLEVELNQRWVYVGLLKVGDKFERTIEITPADVKSFKVLDAVSDNPDIHVSKPEPLPKKRPGYRVVVTIGPVNQVGRVNGRVTIRTDLPHSKEISISVYGKIVAENAPPPAK